jgi:hypothetical protein
MVGPSFAATCAALLAAATLAVPVHARADTDAAEKRELTPADAVATVRVIDNQLTLGERVDSGVTSPDGKRYLLRLIHGDVERNGVWMDLLTGSLDSLEAATHPKLCAHIFTTGLGSTKSIRSSEADTDPTNLIHWINDTQVAFLWSGTNAIRQIVSLDVTSCKHRFLTHSATDVFSFVFAQGGTLLFNAQVLRAVGGSQRLWKRGFTVSDASDGWSILAGNIDSVDASSDGDNAWFIRSADSIRAIDMLGAPVDRTNPFFRDLFLSRTGRFALTDVGVPAIPNAWEQYTNTTLQSLLKINQSIPGRLPLRYALIDLKSGSSRMLWDAPRAFRGQVAWSPNNETLLLAPTFLPLAANNALGLSGTAAAELEVRSGQYHILPVDLTSRTVVSTEWLSPQNVEIRSTNDIGADTRVDRLIREDGHWIVAPTTNPFSNLGPTIRLETRQSLNSPPQVFAVDSASTKSRLVIDPNPHLLERFKLGRVERMSGTLSNGKQWIAQLIYPADYSPGTRYPLVIQSDYGSVFGKEDFNLEGAWGLSGMGLGPSLFPSNPGQLLATKNIAVLTLSVLHFSSGLGQDDDYQLAFESLAQQLVASGIADPLKIALVGFSRNGHWVEFTLAHSAYPFAAALAVDNYDPSYFQSALANWRNEDAQMNDGPAFGDGLQKWIARAVGFNAEHIHTPLYMIGQTNGTQIIMSKWEIFSRLRYLKKPVEMYLMPEANTHPSHNPQNPRQIMAVQEKSIDWLTFWLTGREDPSPQKRDQYARWRVFRTSQASSVSRDQKDP